jgi:tight adherence protein C
MSQSTQMLPFVAAGATFSSVLFLTYTLVRLGKSDPQQDRMTLIQRFTLPSATQESVAVPTHPLIRWLGQRLVTDAIRSRLRRQLDAAGNTGRIALENAVNRKVKFLLIAGGLGLFYALTSGGIAWVLVPLIAAAGFFLPEVLIYNEATKRTEAMSRHLPDAIDLLTLCIDCGLTFPGAVAKVVENQTGPVAEEFARLERELQLGKSRSEALSSLVARNHNEDLLRFLGAVLQGDKMGVPMSSVLREQANDSRARRREHGREEAQKLPVKILMPVVVCFMPGLFIIVLGPAVVSMIGAFSGL